MRSGRVATSEQEGAIAEEPGGMEGVGEAGGNAIASDTDRHPRFGRAFLCKHSSLVLTSEQTSDRASHKVCWTKQENR
jgi:hypothetical protein